jgi:guanylate kinase
VRAAHRQEPGDPSPPPLLIVLSGPSGVGKDTVLGRMKERGLPFHYVVTATTRPPREGEKDGVEYHFLSEEEYDRLLSEDGLLENAEVYGRRYGVPKAQVREALARGQDVIMRVDVQGAATIRKLAPEALFVFLAPASREELEERLRRRRTEAEADFRLRLDTAEREMACREQFDHVVVNEEGRLEETLERVLAVIAAEKARPGRRPVRL